MMADTDAARRRRPSPSRSLLARLSAGAVISAVLVVGGSTLIAAPATAAESDVTVSVATSTQLGPGQDLVATVTLTNAGTETIEPGSIDVVFDPDRIATRAALDDWLDPDGGVPADGPSVRVDTPRLLAAGNSTVTATIPAAAIGLDGAQWGARGLAATYLSGDATVAEGRGAVTWYAGGPVQTTPIAVTMAITAPAGSTGLLSADDLSALTRPGGVLTRQLEGVIGSPVAVGIDPMIIASIRVLGTSAPESAVAWLTQLAGIPNETFPLAWADADVAVQAQAGLTTLLGPISLAYAIDPANFAAPTPTPTPTTTAPSTSAPTTDAATEPPTVDQEPASVMPTTVPTLAELVAWPYTVPGIAWPAPGTVAANDLAAFTASGLPTTIVSSVDLVGTDGTTPRLAATAAGSAVAVSDALLSSALSEAVGAVTDAEWRTAMDEVGAILAVAATEGSSSPAVLAALDRGWPPTSTRLPQTLSALSTFAWAAPAPFATSIGAAPSPVTISPDGESAARVQAVPRLLDGEAQLTAFSTALTDPALLTGSERSRILGLLAVGWLKDRAAWSAAMAEHEVAKNATLSSVSIAPSSDVLVVGSPTFIPVSVKNDFTAPVTVHVEATPSNGRLVVDHGEDVAVGAQSSATVKIPVSAQIGSGEVQLTITLTSPTGVPIGEPYVVVANVHADWEGVGAAIFGAIVVLFFGFGIARTIRRRRREREAAAASTTTDGAEQSSGAGTVAELGDGQEPEAEAEAEQSPVPESESTAEPVDRPRADDATDEQPRG